MWCSKCDKQFPLDCTCPDRDYRIAHLSGRSSHLAMRMCNACGMHADLCKCNDGPTTRLVSEGKIIGAPLDPAERAAATHDAAESAAEAQDAADVAEGAEA